MYEPNQLDEIAKAADLVIQYTSDTKQNVNSILNQSKYGNNSNETASLESLQQSVDRLLKQEESSNLQNELKFKELENKLSSFTDVMTRQIVDLSDQMKSFKMNQRPYSDSPHRFRGRSKSRTRQVTFTDGVCYYHHKFGENATKCDEKCKRYNEFASKRSGNEQSRA